MHPDNVLYETPRLLVRRIDHGDLDAMAAVYGDADAMRWVGDGLALDRAGCERWIGVTLNNYCTRGYGMSALQRKDSGEVIGFCGIVHPGNQAEPEIKYALLRHAWGQGLATEAVEGMLRYAAKGLGLRDVMATTAPENAASHRVLLKAGMTRAERRPESDGTYTQVFRWQRPE
jgi:RimJ/RimL family protein N-acetyltransferase